MHKAVFFVIALLGFIAVVSVAGGKAKGLLSTSEDAMAQRPLVLDVLTGQRYVRSGGGKKGGSNIVVT